MNDDATMKSRRNGDMMVDEGGKWKWFYNYGYYNEIKSMNAKQKIKFMFPRKPICNGLNATIY